MAGFRTELSVNSSPVSIDHRAGTITIGSCFADAIGQQLINHKFATLANPFGPVYNPISIHKLLYNAANLCAPDPEQLIQVGELWAHPDYHSRFCRSSAEEVIQAINESTTITNGALAGCGAVVITYGTAIVFESVSTGEVVANCHKLPGKFFRQRLLTIEEIEADFRKIYATLRRQGVGQFILTVSPVRHLKDTLEINGVSKSLLRLACHRISTTEQNTTYFPAYEIMMDDLRDYRFYAEDMIHPSGVAETYIWQKFSDAYFSKATRELILKWDDIYKALQHRPFHPEGEGYMRFLNDVKAKLISLSPQLDVSSELRSIEIQLKQSAR